jgi:type IV pilus assembly protein PilB
MNDASFEALRLAALESKGFRTLRQDGIEKIRRGVTTPEEIIRVTID